MESKLIKLSPDEFWQRMENLKIYETVNKSVRGEVNEKPRSGRYLKVVCISDTHDKLKDIKSLPDGDVLIHAGDLTNNGSDKECFRFIEKMETFPHKHKLIIPGNHEFGFDVSEGPRLKEYEELEGTKLGILAIREKFTLLERSEVVIEGVKFFGVSYHNLEGYPFYRNGVDRGEAFDAIPTDTDVLITHIAPLGYLDQFEGKRRGCWRLLESVERIKPKFHVFGHEHQSYGVAKNGDTIFINAAQMNEDRQIEAGRPVVFYIPIP